MYPDGDVTGSGDPALDRLGRSGNMSIILTARILVLLQDSGASQVEAHSALNACTALFSSMGASTVSTTASE